MNYCCGISGGKDSTALALWLLDNGYKPDFFFIDTGWEHPTTYAYVDFLRGILGEISVVKSERFDGMEDMIRKTKFFPGRTRRTCTHHLKMAPMLRWMQSKYTDLTDLTNVTGERSEESQKRKGKPDVEFDEHLGCNVWRPIKHWTEKQVFDYIAGHGISPNPLYHQGHTRVGCYPCIYARKYDYFLLSANDNAFGSSQIERIRSMEKDVGYPWAVSDGYYSGIDEALKWAISGNVDMFEPHEPCGGTIKLCGV